MSHYTLKCTAENHLSLYNERGAKVPFTSILTSVPHRRVFALYGQMGAGKTTFIKSLCIEMGISDAVNSPTFAIVNVYDVPGQFSVQHNLTPIVETVYHFDCYRLKSISEALDMGAEEYLYSGQYCFVEWPERIESLLPDDTVQIRLEVISDTERHLTMDEPEP